MALITPAEIRALHTGFSTKFRQGYEKPDIWHPKVATTVPSGTRQETYGWMGRLARLRQWIGPRILNDLSSHVYELENLPYEYTVTVDVDDWADHNLGTYGPAFEDIGQASAEWPDDQLATMIQANPNGFDGVAFFANNHPLDPAGVQTNVFPATALTPANYATVREAMFSFTGENGRPLKVRPNTLIVPPQLERQAKEIVIANTIPDPGGVVAGVTNVNAGSADILVIPEFSNQPTVWYLADTSKSIKPFIWQLRKAPQLVMKTQPNDDGVFFDKDLVWGTDSRGAPGVSLWFLCCRGTA
jgi:phage major head subunit gpT-like protein